MILALRSLLDAASLAMNQEMAQGHVVFGPLAGILDGWSDRLRTGEEDIGRLIFDALEVEIQRWELRSREDEGEEARSVLRAFLGLREFLWELGVRPTTPETANGDATRKNASDAAPTGA